MTQDLEYTFSSADSNNEHFDEFIEEEDIPDYDDDYEEIED